MNLLDRDDIFAYLDELASELPDGSDERVVIVGGAMLAVLGLRDATKDIDTLGRTSEALAGAVARVAARHDLDVNWLNSAATAWTPGDDVVSLIDSDPVLVRPTLRVWVASADAVLVMKLHASRPQDRADIAALWPLCSFETFDAAADACNAAYSHLADPDPYLARYLAGIVTDAQR